MSLVTIRNERPGDEAAREALLDVAYGQIRNQKPSARLRNGRQPADGLSFVAIEHGRMIGTVRLWPVSAGRGRPALLLGPLAVHPDARKRGIGASLVRHALADAARLHHSAVLLVGDLSYYGRFGFSVKKTGTLVLPGADPTRLLGVECVPDSLAGAQGRIAATGRRAPVPALAVLTRKIRPRLVPRAA